MDLSLKNYSYLIKNNISSLHSINNKKINSKLNDFLKIVLDFNEDIDFEYGKSNIMHVMFNILCIDLFHQCSKELNYFEISDLEKKVNNLKEYSKKYPKSIFNLWKKE